jgi:hypothetical protein
MDLVVPVGDDVGQLAVAAVAAEVHLPVIVSSSSGDQTIAVPSAGASARPTRWSGDQPPVSAVIATAAK